MDMMDTTVLLNELEGMGFCDAKAELLNTMKAIHSLGAGDWAHKIPAWREQFPMKRLRFDEIAHQIEVAFRIEIGLGYVLVAYERHISQGAKYLYILFSHSGRPLNRLVVQPWHKHEYSHEETLKDFLRREITEAQPRVLRWLKEQARSKQRAAMRQVRVDMANTRRALRRTRVR